MSFGIPVRNGLGVGLLASTTLLSRRGIPSALSLNFLAGAPLDSRITFTRSTTATFVGSDGIIQSAAIDAPRFDYDPVTLAPKGLLIEEARTNLLLNSTINGAVLSTQNVTVTAVAHTISFYGTGTITLSGVAVAAVVGTGVYPNRRTLTFTPTAGVLICTVVGSVQFAQLEIGSFATSYIPTAGTAVARNADIAIMTGANFASWYNQSEGTFVASASQLGALTANTRILSANDGTTSESVQLTFAGSGTTGYAEVRDASVAVVSMTNGSFTGGSIIKIALGVAVNNAALSTNGTAPTTDVTVTMPTVDRLNIGSNAAAATPLNGHLRSITYYKTRLPNAQLQALTV